jgi:4-hydroxy-tetrahydrodipicolinate synthase
MHGIFVPLVTPLKPDETVDLPSMARLIDYLLSQGVHGFWLLGTSGEFAAVNSDERRQLVESVLEHVGDRVPVVVNVSDGSTRLAVEHAKHARAVGARWITSTPPYYYPHTMDEVAEHMRVLRCAAPDARLYLYNIPQTVKVRVPVSTIADLAADGTISGIKDSQNDMHFIRDLLLTLQDRGVKGFRTFAGTRSLIDAAVFIGADGAVPAVSNIAAAECVAAYTAAVAGDVAGARAAQERALRYEALARAAASGSANAATLAAMKEVLRLRGILRSATISAPLRPLAFAEREELAKRLAELDGASS